MGFISTFVETTNAIASTLKIGDSVLREHMNHGCSVLIFCFRNDELDGTSIIQPVIINRTNDPILVTGFSERNNSWIQYGAIIKPHTIEGLTTKLEYVVNDITQIKITSNVGTLRSNWYEVKEGTILFRKRRWVYYQKIKEWFSKVFN